MQRDDPHPAGAVGVRFAHPGPAMPTSRIDHLVVTAFTLEAGEAYVRDALGVPLEPGGEHPRMGTHNRLLRLGEALFLEVIAPNPAAPAPSRPRWFSLDRLRPASPPSLSMWVVRTTDIRTVAIASTEPLGSIEPMTRGALDWQITIPADGSVPLDGVGPALIQWGADRHPADGLSDCGLSLARLDIVHPEPDRVSRLLRSLALDAPVAVRRGDAGERPHLMAHVDTPQGRRVLASADPAAVRG